MTGLTFLTLTSRCDAWLREEDGVLLGLYRAALPHTSISSNSAPSFPRAALRLAQFRPLFPSFPSDIRGLPPLFPTSSRTYLFSSRPSRFTSLNRWSSFLFHRPSYLRAHFFYRRTLRPPFSTNISQTTFLFHALVTATALFVLKLIDPTPHDTFKRSDIFSSIAFSTLVLMFFFAFLLFFTGLDSVARMRILESFMHFPSLRETR